MTSLNDLHRAAGGQKRPGPSYWLAAKQTKDLIADMETAGIPVVTAAGLNGGTFVAKELVYAYAMWISPAPQSEGAALPPFAAGQAFHPAPQKIGGKQPA